VDFSEGVKKGIVCLEKEKDQVTGLGQIGQTKDPADRGIEAGSGQMAGELTAVSEDQMNQEPKLVIVDQKENQLMMRHGTKKDQETKRESLQMVEELLREVHIDPIIKAVSQDEMAEEKSGAQEKK
jgi:hypothetical protein